MPRHRRNATGNRSLGAQLLLCPDTAGVLAFRHVELLEDAFAALSIARRSSNQAATANIYCVGSCARAVSISVLVSVTAIKSPQAQEEGIIVPN